MRSQAGEVKVQRGELRRGEVKVLRREARRGKVQVQAPNKKAADNSRLDRERWADAQAEAKRIMEAFEGRRGDRCSTEVAEIENGFQPWKHRSTTVEMEETAVDVWFRKHVGRQDTLHAKIEWLRDKLHKHISYRYRIALCIEPERNEALVESAGITVKEQSVLAAWDTVTQPEGKEQDEEDWEESGSGDGSEGEDESEEEYESGTGGGSEDEEGDSDSS